MNRKELSSSYFFSKLAHLVAIELVLFPNASSKNKGKKNKRTL